MTPPDELLVHVVPDRCVGAGTCAHTAPEVFDTDESTGMVVVLEPAPPTDLHAAVRAAARRCPTEAIRLSDRR